MSQTQVQTTGYTDSSVTNAKIANDAVTAAKIATGAVGTTEIADSAVTFTKIDGGSYRTSAEGGIRDLSSASDNQLVTEKSVSELIIPIGGIIMWSGSIATIPPRWALCNGLNNTPDLRDKFVVGAGSGYAVAATGGSAAATLVSHTHTVTSTSAAVGGAFRSFFISINRVLRFPPNDAINGLAEGADFTDADTSSVGRGTINSAGTTPPITNTANLPPYYALAFIMRIS